MAPVAEISKAERIDRAVDSAARMAFGGASVIYVTHHVKAMAWTMQRMIDRWERSVPAKDHGDIICGKGKVRFCCIDRSAVMIGPEKVWRTVIDPTLPPSEDRARWEGMKAFRDKWWP